MGLNRCFVVMIDIVISLADIRVLQNVRFDFCHDLSCFLDMWAAME